LRRLYPLALASLAAVLWTAGPAHAAGGTYTVDGGTARERAQVTRALQASRFDWDVIPGSVAIHIRRGLDSHSTPGEVWLDRDVLNAGVFSWAVVQDEYAHQLDFALFDDAVRARLTVLLGGRAWCSAVTPGLKHSDYACERFASTLVWAYWPSALNAYRPETAKDEAAALPAPRFRRLVESLVAERLATTRSTR
jgi:hypothetical protein